MCRVKINKIESLLFLPNTQFYETTFPESCIIHCESLSSQIPAFKLALSRIPKMRPK